MKIWLDDNCDNAESDRLTPDEWVGVKNFFEFKKLVENAVENGDTIEAIDFDNDLGEKPGGGFELEGREILKWLNRQYPELTVGKETELRTHSSNPAANEAMKKDIEFWRSHAKEVLAEKDRPDPWDTLPEDIESKNRR